MLGLGNRGSHATRTVCEDGINMTNNNTMH
jgi:hypothetical protein